MPPSPPDFDRRTVSDAMLAAGADGEPALIDGNRRYSYGELRVAAARVAAELRDRGVLPGDRIGLVGPNSFFWVAGYLAAMQLGTVVPFLDKAPPADLASQADWVDCSAVLVDRRLLRRYGDCFGDRPVITDAVLTAPGPGWWPPPGPEAPSSDAALIFTSGTTAEPKAVRITHANLLANTRSIVTYLGLGADDRMLVILPFHYCYGASLLHTHLAVGGSVVLCNTFAFPQTAVDLLDREACTGMAGVPSSFQLLLRASDFATHPLPSLRHVQQAGGKLAPSLIERLAGAQPGSRLFVMYGQTEATARLSYLPPERLRDKLGSIGRGIPDVELTVVGEDGGAVAPGDVGEIMAKGPNISPGYYKDPRATAEKFPGGLLRSGDLATVDVDGFIYIVGRRDDFIKTWGYRVSGQQVESAVLQLPQVVEAAAVGLPDADAGEAIHLAVRLEPDTDLTIEQILTHLRQQLPKHAVPSRVHLVDELPLTANGKVSKQQLRSVVENLAGELG